MKVGEIFEEGGVALWVEKKSHPIGNLLELRGSLFFATKKRPDQDGNDGEHGRDEGESEGGHRLVSVGRVGWDAKASDVACEAVYTMGQPWWALRARALSARMRLPDRWTAELLAACANGVARSNKGFRHTTIDTIENIAIIYV